MSIIFISYRRGDSAGHTGRLFDALRNRFGSESVFRDIDNLEPGIDFIEALDNALDKCDALLVVIGDKWTSTTESHGRRLDQSDDFVRTEVAKALERNVRVIPVLVADAKMPRAEELPKDLHALVRRNAIELSDTRWDYDVNRLCDTLARVLGDSEQAATDKASTQTAEAPMQQSTEAPASRGVGMPAKLTGGLIALIALVVAVSLKPFSEKKKSTEMEQSEPAKSSGILKNSADDILVAPARQDLPGAHVVVFDAFKDADRSGFNFAAGDLVSWYSGKADIGVSNYEPPGPQALLFAQNETGSYSSATQDKGANSGIQEMPGTRFEDVQECPVSDYQVHWVKATVNSVYCVRLRDGKHYAKIKLTNVEPDRIAFDWIYQPSGSRLFK